MRTKRNRRDYLSLKKDQTFFETNINNFSITEEIWHAISHGIGLLFSIAGLVILVIIAAYHSNATGITASAIYGATLIIMYGSSTFYHAARKRKVKKILQIFDHASIYFLIAGTYTPITLITLHGPWGWSLFGINWAIAAFGVALKFLYPRRFEMLSLILYVIMGWLIIVAVNPIVHAMPIGGLLLMLLGGLFYTFGIIFYVKDEKHFFHTIWHFFVLAGSISHYFMVLFYIILQ
ncbi:PAQR family membrane homeostasis protein TrhA [Sulfurospirillum sp. 1612]|uniref:PAQR family membrane homeostasis protein TrhA n=1 Tax=Sulfurospirillum sp. 1612 TaxID=3094835 RepID=UPI002F923CA8